MPSNRVLVPIETSSTARQTVEYAVRTVLEDGTDEDTPGYVRFVYVCSTDRSEERSVIGGRPSVETGEELLTRMAVWANEDAGERADEITIETGLLGLDAYLFSPEDLARAIVDEAEAHDIERVVLDPEYDPGIGAPFLRPLEYELTRFGSLRVEEAPVTRRIRRGPLLARTSLLQIGALFGISFLFYQILAGSIDAFDLVTGAMAALVVAVGLSRVTFGSDPSWQTLARSLRLVVYVPYLLYEIIVANVAVAMVILHPKLPIDPRMTLVRPAIWGPLPITTFANSITLTPGTLTVRVDGRTLMVHTLVPGARRDLFSGRLERAVRFVFWGRRSMRIQSLEERGNARILPTTNQNGSDSTATDSSGETAHLDDDVSDESDEGTVEHDDGADEGTDVIDDDDVTDGFDAADSVSEADTDSPADDGGDDS